MAEKLLHNYPYLIAALIFAVGCYIVLSHTNLMRKIIGVNVMETAVFLFLVAAGNVRGGKPPSSTWPIPMLLTSTRCPRP